MNIAQLIYSPVHENPSCLKFWFILNRYYINVLIYFFKWAYMFISLE